MITALAAAPAHNPTSLALSVPAVALSIRDQANAATLFRQFDVLALGEGDPTAGVNTLAVMALTLACIAPPRSCLASEKDGSRIMVGMGMLVTGALSCSLVEDRVLEVLQTRQNHLYGHVRQALEVQKAKAARGDKSQPRSNSISPPPLEQLDHPDSLHFSGNEALLRKLLRPSGSSSARDITEFPVLFATVSSAKGLEAALNFAHQGRPLVHVALAETADHALLAQVCAEVTGGCSKLSPLMGSACGHAIATDPVGVLDELVRDGGTPHGWLHRLLWLGEHGAGPAFELGDANDSDPLWSRAEERFEKAFETVAAIRLNFQNPEPMQLSCEFASEQAEWNTFLRSLESRFPGITGTLRPLPASLCFGLWQMVLVDGQDAQKFDIAGVMAFARMLALRMAHAREFLHHDGYRARLDALATTLRFKLADGPLTIRDLTRKSHRLDAATCQEALERLVDSGLVIRSGNQWKLAASKQTQALTLNV